MSTICVSIPAGHGAVHGGVAVMSIVYSVLCVVYLCIVYALYLQGTVQCTEALHSVVLAEKLDGTQLPPA
jgi:hypothetical protein